MTVTPPTDTQRRARIRSRESVARWRISSAVWGARVFAVILAVLSILPLLRRDHPDWISTTILVLLALSMFVAGEFLRRGSRTAAILLVIAFVAAKLLSWLGGDPIYAGALWTIIILGALLNGVWGAFELTAVKREAATVPPAPTRASRGPAV
jgi:hypothetical protein